MRFTFILFLTFSLNLSLVAIEDAEGGRDVPSAAQLKDARGLLDELLESERKEFRAKKLSTAEYGEKLMAYLGDAE